MAEFSRPVEGFRFNWGGLKLNAEPDACPPDKYPSAVNIRSNKTGSVRARYGYSALFNTGNNAASITDIRSYATLGTDDTPRFLVRNANDQIYLDTGSLQTTLSGNNHGYGASMVPFRPGASPQSWMYVAGQSDYQKISAPDGNNNTTAYAVGIAEPQSQLEAAPNAPTFTSFFATAGSWTAGGTAGAPANSNLFTDTVGAAVIADPIVSSLLSVQVVIPYYAPGMLVTFAGTNTYPVEGVFQACDSCTVSAIRYDSGTTGACSIVPSVDLSSTLRRGSLIRLNASETVLVLSVTQGTNNTCVIRTSTAGTIAAGNSIAGILAITVHGTVSAADAITVPDVTSAITAGTATLSRAISANTFSPYLLDDYIHATLLLQNIAAVTSVSFIFNVSNTVDYATSILTYTITGSALAALLLAGEVVSIAFPISALSGDPGALNPCNGFRVQVVTSASQTIGISGFWVGGGNPPDVGDTGAPYMFRAVPRSTVTGARGNATPPMRYGVFPRRQSVTVSVPSASYDSQIDIWDYYAIGGSVTQYGYVGSAVTGASSFSFNFFDDAIRAAIANGNTLPTQNYEPWPSIDVPWSVASGGGNTITAVGTYVTVSGPASWPATITRWLPGTLVTLSGFQTYTLRARPVSLGGTSYLFELQECLGSQSPTKISVAEPNVARQILPYVWGPDAYGTVFANGDPLRPGTQYFATPYAPDEAPQQNTIELTSPDKPLVGGCVKGGVSVCASTEKWWALYPVFSPTNQVSGYTQVDWPVGRASISPYAITTDGQWVYFWGRDGIYRTGGGGAESLTDKDLYNLFPHEGYQPQDIVSFTVSYYAPDYSRASAFRLSIVNNLLFADYRNTSNVPCTLTCDLRNMAWTVDQYADSITSHYQPPQAPGTVAANNNTLNPLMVMTDSAGKVWKEARLTNDGSGANNAIQGLIATFQYDGGDLRAKPIWGDLYLDCIPAAQGVQVGNAAVLVFPCPAANTTAANTGIPPFEAGRIFTPIQLPGGQTTSKFMGLMAQWFDDYTGNNQTVPTQLFAWQPSFVMKPELIVRRLSDWYGSMAGG